MLLLSQVLILSIFNVHVWLKVYGGVLLSDGTCESLCFVYKLATSAGLCILSTTWRHVQFCALCLHSGDT